MNEHQMNEDKTMETYIIVFSVRNRIYRRIDLIFTSVFLGASVKFLTFCETGG